jgi:choloylglycine hydrolase
MAYVCDNYPLYYDAMNEKGLCMAGLNFVGNAFFGKEKEGKDNIGVFEFIPWILSQCESVKEAELFLEKINLTDTPFNDALPTAQLHWLIADKTQAITVESMKDGLHIHNNPVGVLTNNPPFPYQMHNLNNYMNLSAEQPVNNFSAELEFSVYSKGMGAIGLPGDLSSQSRFVRTAFVKVNSVSDDDESSSVNQFFHILGSVDQQRGCCKVDNKYEITVYTSCMNADSGIYYYTTYENHQISAVNMHKENLDSDRPVSYPIIRTEQIKAIN